MADETTNQQIDVQQEQVFDRDDATRYFNARDTWTSGLNSGRTKIITDPEDPENKVLSVEFEEGTRGHVQWQSDLGGVHDSATLEYRFMFVDQGDGFDFQRGGKLPGLGGGTLPTGGAVSSDGLGFTTRFNWIERSSSSSDTHISAYMYDMDNTGTGDHMRLSYADPSRTRAEQSPRNHDDAIVLEDGRWYTIKQEVIMNTPGQDDGVLRVWLDGQLALELTDLELRSRADLGIDTLYFSTFFGGSNTSDWQAAKDEFIYYDDFRVTLEDGTVMRFDVDHPFGENPPVGDDPPPVVDEPPAGNDPDMPSDNLPGGAPPDDPSNAPGAEQLVDGGSLPDDVFTGPREGLPDANPPAAEAPIATPIGAVPIEEMPADAGATPDQPGDCDCDADEAGSANADFSALGGLDEWFSLEDRSLLSGRLEDLFSGDMPCDELRDVGSWLPDVLEGITIGRPSMTAVNDQLAELTEDGIFDNAQGPIKQAAPVVPPPFVDFGFDFGGDNDSSSI